MMGCQIERGRLASAGATIGCVCVLLACACSIPYHRKRGCRVTPSGALVTGYTGRTCRGDLFPPGPLPGKRGGDARGGNLA
mgnify:CR=1 FL=1